MAPSSSSSSAATTSVQVALRIRPQTTQDSINIPARFQRSVINATSSTSVTVDAVAAANSGPGAAPSGVSSASAPPPKKQSFAFDQVHGPGTTQHTMFTSTAEPLIARFLEGFNCTILAYGQTSSGKTFTMTGIDLDADPADPNNGMGIVPRAVSTIFGRANKLKSDRAGSWNFQVKGSFIEIYNEDLIDLLSMDDPSGGRREVLIREDKSGQIIWGGLREVNVKSANEVMELIRRGTSIRRTNETDMNAQSSRSHAIFSLTLTQRKYTGSGAPPRSSSPLPPAGRSPSRLARPGSTYTGGSTSGSRVASPTFGRPPTPSFASAMGRGGGLRPSSALGHSSDKTHPNDDAGEWVTIVSKFHFVDLAGSERLKRTAAAGERIKEGISINSGLLALGNVISALGDPSRAKSHTASHIPYRDSKLTRLLQDSLGGNAHTLMIACISPAEYNAGETINTLKYANRARNIKNRAVVNQKEEGWDDLEWLQGTVTRLRKEMKTLKEGGVVADSKDLSADMPLEGAGRKVLAQMTELQNNYEDLREKFVQRTEELTRLRRELGESHRNSSGVTSGTAKYEEIVGPVIEEYEKTIATMEAELSLNRIALRHTNEMVEEKEEELSSITNRHAATELYVEELRSRLSKLTEREASTEAYVHDLEEKVKNYDETSISSSESMTDLKRELVKLRESEKHSTTYIQDLEARLARSDENILSLQQNLERLEQECERRREEAEVLQARLNALRQDGDSWRSDLEKREQRVKQLEEQMAVWEQRRREVGEERLRLGEVAEEVASARKSLEADIAKSKILLNGDEYPLNGMETPPSDSALETQFIALQQTHQATLVDLASVTAKYRDALTEISDLAAQIQESKLNNEGSDPMEKFPETPTVRRRKASGKSQDGDQHKNGGRRLFFKHAASTESLRSRSLSQSQSLSQELFSVHSRKTSFSSYSNNSHSPTTSSVGSPRHRNLSISVPNTASLNPHERSASSYEKEIMRLQEVLKEREAEILALESSVKATQESSLHEEPNLLHPNGDVNATTLLSPKTMHQFDSIRKTMENGHVNGDVGVHENGDAMSDGDGSLERLNELMLSMAQKESQHKELVESLNDQLTQTKRNLDELKAISQNQATNMSAEFESLRAKHNLDLEKLEEVQKHEALLTEQLHKAEEDYAVLQEDLRSERERILKNSQDLVEWQQKATDANARCSRLEEEHKQVLEKIKVDHEESVKKKESESSRVLHETEEDYYNMLTKLRADHAEVLAKQSEESTAALERLREEHAGELRQAEIARQGLLSESESSQTVALTQLREEHSTAISRKEASFAEEMEALKADHARALATKDEDLTIQAEKFRVEHDNLIAKLKEEWRLENENLNTALTALKSEQAASAAKAQTVLEDAVRAVKEQQTEILREVEKGREDEIAELKAIHGSALESAVKEAEQKAQAVLSQHTEEIVKLKGAHEAKLAEVNNTMVALQDQHTTALKETRRQTEQTLLEEKQRLTSLLEDLKVQHAGEIETLRKDHDIMVQELEAHKVAADEFTLLRTQSREAHEQRMEEKSSTIKQMTEKLTSLEYECDSLTAEAASLRSELKKTKSEQSQLIAEASKRESLVVELERHRSVLAELQENLQKVKDEKDNLQSEKSRVDSLVKDLQTQIANAPSAATPTPPARPVLDRNVSSFTRPVPGAKLPPPTPPPTVPPPPAPRSQHPISESSQTSTNTSLSLSVSSRDSQLESPVTSISSRDPKIDGRLEQQIKQREEQEAMIKTLNKQLSHCESDLQTHIDLVSTLETTLGESEKNLRKARMHATELARERDALNQRVEQLRAELSEAKKEVLTTRQSIAEEKQSYEQKLDEERRQKERARQQLDARMDELQKRKSKFACL